MNGANSSQQRAAAAAAAVIQSVKRLGTILKNETND